MFGVYIYTHGMVLNIKVIFRENRLFIYLFCCIIYIVQRIRYHFQGCCGIEGCSKYTVTKTVNFL